MARRYDIQGTNNYIIAASVFLLIGAWHFIDGWFPRQSVRDIHPKEVVVKASAAGVVAKIEIALQQEVADAVPLIRLKTVETPAKEITLSMQDELNPKAKVHSGEVAEIHVQEKAQVSIGQPLVTLKATRDSYYLYNKTTAVITLLGALICGIIHRLVR